ncbi:MAG: aminoacyl-tRNA hydrolase [Candidatus Subteraquimicrobiales bacterium]|nr:aminoacyl-tRNA hydrolase [Candidatus Subteraquimicrobiales bacterium]
MKIIIGLGNLGSKHQNNRHNAGYMVIDKLSQILNSKSETLNKSKIQIHKSKSYMNNSGSFVLEKLKAYNIKPEALYVIHDDLDIKLGEFKIQFGKGPKEHKGLISIYEALGTREFWHVRVGIENRQQAISKAWPTSSVGTRAKGEEYVLQDFTGEERVILNGVIKQICNQLENL